MVRVGFCLLATAGGVGVLLYGAGWLLLPGDDGASALVRPRAPQDGVDTVDAVAFGAIVLGSLLLLRQVGLWFPDKLIWPVVLAAVGLALVWGRASAGDSDGSGSGTPFPTSLSAAVNTLTGAGGRQGVVRVASGVVLVIGGAGAFAAVNGSFAAVRQGLIAGLVLTAGLALILGPWLFRLSNDLLAERRAHIRSQERADMAVHLHDSVLQTLAVIQRRADQPREVVSLARRQERELRTWLYQTGGGAAGGAHPERSFSAALQGAAAEVEAAYDVPVDVVRVGDAPMDERVRALVGAAREAMTNAAKHSGAASVDVYAEVSEQRIEVFVRDRGKGFDAVSEASWSSTEDNDRRGITDSIHARMTRHGGEADIRSRPGEGTEVELVMPI